MTASYEQSMLPSDAEVLDRDDVKAALRLYRTARNPRNKHDLRTVLCAAGVEPRRLDHLIRLGLRGRRWSGAENLTGGGEL